MQHARLSETEAEEAVLQARFQAAIARFPEANAGFVQQGLAFRVYLGRLCVARKRAFVDASILQVNCAQEIGGG